MSNITNEFEFINASAPATTFDEIILKVAEHLASISVWQDMLNNDELDYSKTSLQAESNQYAIDDTTDGIQKEFRMYMSDFDLTDDQTLILWDTIHEMALELKPAIVALQESKRSVAGKFYTVANRMMCENYAKRVPLQTRM